MRLLKINILIISLCFSGLAYTKKCTDGLSKDSEIEVLFESIRCIEKSSLDSKSNLSNLPITVPIGTIMAWNNSMKGPPSLPPNWREANGSIIFDTESPYYQSKLPDLNGERYFLRGGGTSGNFEAQDWKSFSVGSLENGGYVHNDVIIPKTGYNTQLIFGGKWASPGSHMRFKFDDSEIRPKNMSVIWIIKIK